MNHSEQIKVLEKKMKKKAANSREPPRKLVHDATVTRECAVALPNYKSLARSIQRQSNPTILKDVSTPLELQLKLREPNFLAWDSAFDDRKRFLFSNTEQNLDLLKKNTPQWQADRTFKNCATLFHQLYTIHSVVTGRKKSPLYMLLSGRQLFFRVLNEQIEINPCLQPYQLTADFEIACL